MERASLSLIVILSFGLGLPTFDRWVVVYLAIEGAEEAAAGQDLLQAILERLPALEVTGSGARGSSGARRRAQSRR